MRRSFGIGDDIGKSSRLQEAVDPTAELIIIITRLDPRTQWRKIRVRK